MSISVNTNGLHLINSVDTLWINSYKQPRMCVAYIYYQSAKLSRYQMMLLTHLHYRQTSVWTRPETPLTSHSAVDPGNINMFCVLFSMQNNPERNNELTRVIIKSPMFCQPCQTSNNQVLSQTATHYSCMVNLLVLRNVWHHQHTINGINHPRVDTTRKPSYRWQTHATRKPAKIAPIRRAYNVVADNIGLSSCV